MQLSYRVIKNVSAVNGDSKSIVTEYLPKTVEKMHTDVDDEQAIAEDNINSMMESYENIAQGILNNARAKADKLLAQTLTDVQIMKEDAYREGYDSGYEEGSKNGYKDAYDEEIVKARLEAEQIVDSANNTLMAAKEEYERYMEENKDNILNLAFSIAQRILKREIERFDGMDSAVLDALENSKGAESVIIRANSTYVDSLKDKIADYQYKMGKQCSIMVLPDDNLEKGIAVIERSNGRAEIDVNKGLENIASVLN